MHKVLITTVPFGALDPTPISLLEKKGISYVINPLGRKLTPEELAPMAKDFDAIIAGTEEINKEVLESACQLKFISRVGVGLDSVDLAFAKKKGISVSYTANAPTAAVAELTIGFIFTLLRNVQRANINMHAGKWNRYFGRRITNVCIGIIGCGRIGRQVVGHLLALGASDILIHDIDTISGYEHIESIKFVDKETIFRESDVLSLHLPLTTDTKNLIGYKELMQMKANAILINTARGGIVNERDLSRVFRENHLSGAAIDVFEREPYRGELSGFEQCLLTSHMGSMSLDCRARMEIEATEEVIRFFEGKQLLGSVPIEEYENQKDRI